MLNEKFVESIKGLSEAGIKPEVLDIDGNQRIVVVGGKVIYTYRKDEPFGSISVSEFSSFVDAAIVLSKVAELSVVKVSTGGITICCDGNKPHKKATASLEFKDTAAFQCLQAWEKQPKSVATINKLLRTALVGTFDDRYISVFKQIEFARAGATVVSKTAHRDTMGKSVDNAVKSAAGDIPEVLSFLTPLLVNAPSEPVTLRYYVDVNHDNETIGLAAMGDFVNEAMRETVLALVERLRQELPTALVVAS